MDWLFNSLGVIFEALFSIIPFLGTFTNLLIIFLLAAGVVFWIFYMVRDDKGKDNYLSR